MDLLQPVQLIMTENPITLDQEDKLTEVDKIFTENRIHHIPILNKNKFVGILSKSDYLFFRRGTSRDRTLSSFDKVRIHNHKTKEIMTTGVATLQKDDRISVAIELFHENYFHCIPIVENGELEGILTPYDIIKFIRSKQNLSYV